MNLNSSKGVYKRNADSKVGVSFSSGGRTRTYDLWVMSPTSYHCSTPRCYLQVQSYDLFLKHANYLAKKIKKICLTALSYSQLASAKLAI